MLKLQKEFQDKYGFYPELKDIASALTSEGIELWKASEGKWWSKKKYPHSYKVEELVDLLHFFLLYMIVEQITPEELFEAYCSKLKENYARQERGY